MELFCEPVNKRNSCEPSFCQGELQMFDILLFVYKQTSSGKKSPKCIPVVLKRGFEASEADSLVRKCTHPKSAPLLFLFFSKDGDFQFAQVAADEKVVHLQAADVVKAVIGFIGFFFVFHVGYATPHAAFLAFLQEAFLATNYEAKKTMSLTNFTEKFEKDMAQYKSLRGFKRVCIDAK